MNDLKFSELLSNKQISDLVNTIAENRTSISEYDLFYKFASFKPPSKEEIDFLLFLNLEKYLQSKTYCGYIGHHPKDHYVKYIYNTYFGYLIKFYAIKEISKDKNFINKLFSKSKNHSLIMNLINSNIYTIESLKSLYNSDNIGIQNSLLNLGIYEALVELRKSKDITIRCSAYKQLGPAFFEEMLKDKSIKINLLGIKHMPYGYEVPSKLLNSKSEQVLFELALKVSPNQLPFLITNKNSHRTLIIVNSRMNCGI